jgi:hypothetical protein
MTNLDIARQRLHNQRLARPTLETAAEVVAWLGAVQAQDYLGALWAVGLRMRNATESAVEQAIANKTIVRTWPMRGTIHFVPPADARWMLALLAPRVIARSARLHQQFDLDERTFARSKELLAGALQGGKQLARPEIYQVLEQGNISTGANRGLHILGRLAQEGLICFGARKGRQATFALLDEWAPAARRLQGDEALAELARRYFTSHGPATVQDFAWWSGLAMAEANAALDMARSTLVEERSDGRRYWLSAATPPASTASPSAYLLPPYDEYTVAYKDRSAVLDPAYTRQASYGIGPTVVVGGQIAGSWKRTLKKGEVIITPELFVPLDEAGASATAEAAHRYGEFLGLAVCLVQSTQKKYER